MCKYLEKDGIKDNAIANIYAQDITSWAEMKQVVNQLKKKEVKDIFKTVIIDTVDVASQLCEKYICNQNDVDTISQIPYGGGWGLLKKEFPPQRICKNCPGTQILSASGNATVISVSFS